MTKSKRNAPTPAALALRSGLLILAASLALTAGCARSPEAKKARYLERGDRYVKAEQHREAIIEYRNALRIDGNSAHAIRQLGLAHFQLGQFAQAYRFLLKARELEPADSEVALRLANVYLVGGRASDARREAEVVLQREPMNLDALILAASAASSPEETEGAIRQLEAGRATFGEQAKFQLALGNLYFRKGDYAAAEAAFRAAVARHPKSVEAHTTLGRFYAARSDPAQAERELKAAADLAPSTSAAPVRLAGFYLVLRRPEEAKRVLAEATTRAPENLAAWRLLAEVAAGESRFDEATKAVDLVLKKNPGDPDALFLQGRIRLATDDTTAAIQTFQALVKAEPRFAPAHYYLGLAHLRAGNTQQAKAEFSVAASLAPNLIEAALALADLNIRTGAVQVAIDDLTKLLASQPTALGAYVALAGAYLRQRQPAKAVEVATKFIVAAPKDARGPYLLGLGFFGQGKRVEARQQFEASLALAPGFLDPLSHLALLSLAEKQAEAAIERVKKQISLVPQSGAHRALLGEIYLSRGDTKSGEQALLSAIELEPGLVGPYLRLGAIYSASGQYEQALARINEAVKRSPGNPGPLMIAGTLYERKGDIPRAREAYEKALTLNPRFAPAANNLAWIYSEFGGDAEKALQLAQVAKQVAPDDPRISDTLGWILYKRGVYQRALALLQESATKLPGNPQVQYHLGMAYTQVGDKDNARRALSAATGSPVEFTGKDEARKVLSTLK